MNIASRLVVLSVAGLALSLVCFISIVFAGYRQGYLWAEMDWAQKGYTTPWDVIAASDIGKRPAAINPQRCQEYCSYKDGLPIKTVCTTH